MISVTASAPVRINDIGGWTDTWFAERGRVLNLAVKPGVSVTVKSAANPSLAPKRVRLNIIDFSESILMDPDHPDYQAHSILQAAINSVPIPKENKIEISIFSSVPAASSTGTSAAVCVALLGALFRAVGSDIGPEEIAYRAHQIETEKLGLQSGIQDQLSAAFGGVCSIKMTNYPHADVNHIKLPKKIALELNNRLCLIYLGRSHRSSALHEKVITMLEKAGPAFSQLNVLSRLAEEAVDCLVAGDLAGYGDVMIRNNECQRELHPDLISPAADAVISAAGKYRARGWKVNGAGGEGGSITILGSSDQRKRKAMLQEIGLLGAGIQQIPVSLSYDGLVVTKHIG